MKELKVVAITERVRTSTLRIMQTIKPRFAELDVEFTTSSTHEIWGATILMSGQSTRLKAAAEQRGYLYGEVC